MPRNLVLPQQQSTVFDMFGVDAPEGFAPKVDKMSPAMSFSFDQDEILLWVMALFNDGDRFDIDATYGKGNFYSGKVPKPARIFDAEPQPGTGAEQGFSYALPLEDASVGSIVYDPPFLPYTSEGSVIKEHFRQYSSYGALREDWSRSMDEFWRVLRPGGFVLFKYQNSVSSGSNVWLEDWLRPYCYLGGWKRKDAFFLMSTSTINHYPGGMQYHARKGVSFFDVWEKPK